MACALASNADYPDYLKSILKEIEAGNDKELKDCACSLKTPTTDEGCPIVDEDGKVIAFPFCLRDTNPNLSSNENYNEFFTSNIGLSYKEAMKLYWKRDSFNLLFEASGSAARGDLECPMLTSSASTSLQSEIIDLKNLVCGTAKGAAINSLDDEGKPGWTCRSDNCGGQQFYSTSCYYFGVLFYIFLEYFVDGSRAWIDKEAQLIYPYIHGFESLNGCCGSLGPESWSVSSSSITINTNSKTPGWAGGSINSSGKIIVSF